VFASKGILSSSPLQAAGLSNGVNMAESNVKTRHSLELLSHTNGQCNPLSEQAAARSILNHALKSVLPESALLIWSLIK